ncbi:glycosyltransferase [Aureisphaera sp. CAU 1614]|uniref:Glycosyltransferase n=1 Tax=Halomarinibacterium sedimenti TaxID=2857106 RepID=A0A9X1FMM1_9FLAO|nr:glycosyltransferase [Halomarinibacterium sedimenti]MBW2937438.1 glycosyltransferase [Halomarinibacterium sedimenti]
MKILMVINSLATGGAEKLLLESIPKYKAQGVIVDLLLLNGKSYPFLDELREISDCKEISLGEGSVYNPALIFRLTKHLKNYDIVHTHLFPSLYWVVFSSWLSFSKTKLVYTEHSTSNRRRNKLILKMLDRIIYSGVDKIITIADEVDFNVKKHLRTKESKFILINNGIDLKKFEEAIPYEKSKFFRPLDTILIQVSSFREQKDQATLIRSIAILPENFKLLLVGDGPLKNDLETLVATLKLENRVKFLGIRNDIPRLLKTADASVLSSFHEGLSLSSIEGMAVGKPFIASKVPGLREIVDGYGLLFKKGDELDLANTLKNLFQDKKRYEEISKRCYSRAQDFSIEKMINKHIELYKNLLIK